MYILHRLINGLFALIHYPFRHLSPFWPVLIISAVTGLLFLFIFKWTSNQDALRKVKNKIKAHIFSIRLFDVNPGQLFAILGRILAANFRYISLFIVPFVFLVIPFLFVAAQIDARYSYRGLEPGEQALLKVQLAPELNPMKITARLQLPKGLQKDIGPLRNLKDNELVYRITCEEPHDGDLVLHLQQGEENQRIDKLCNMTPLAAAYSRARVTSLLQQVLHPLEKPLDANGPVQRITLQYPRQSIVFLWIHWHPLVLFVVLSVVIGFAVKGLFKVEI